MFTSDVFGGAGRFSNILTLFLTRAITNILHGFVANFCDVLNSLFIESYFAMFLESIRTLFLLLWNKCSLVTFMTF